MALVAGIDSSTQSTKVLLVDADDGRIVAQGAAPHPSTTPPCSEQDPEAWWVALQTAWAQCGPVTGRVEAIAVAGQQHGMVALDGAGVPVHPAKLWNDTESAPQAARLVAEVGAAEWVRRVGSVPGAAFTVTKVAWLSDEHPDAFARVERLLLPHDWLTWRLLGRPEVAVTDRGDASGTGWWSPQRGSVDDDLLALVGARPAWLPRVAAPFEVVGEATGVAAGARVAPGTGDNMGAALGLGVAPGELVLSLGTSGTAFTVCEVAAADATGAVAGFADATGRFLPLVCTSNATKVTEWALGLAGRSSADLDDVVRDGPARPDVTVLPYLDGERTPNRPNARGVIAGVSTNTTLADLVRAAVVGVVCSLLDGADRLTGADESGPIRLVGGGARSAAYRQAVADLARRPVVHAPDDREWVAYGAAVQAAACQAGVSLAEQSSRWMSVATATTEPAMPVELAAELRARHRALAEGTVHR